MKSTSSKARFLHLLRSLLMTALVIVCQISVDAAGGGRQVSYGSPEEAVQDLVAALKEGNDAKLAEILGPDSETLISSGDAVADRAGRTEFLSLYEKGSHIDLVQPDKAILTIGLQDYPVPIPVVKRGASWIFDTDAGREEILDRRIGKNELEAIETAHAYVDAQREYAARAHEPARPAEFAQKLLSTPGKRDGLFWEAKAGEEESPMGPLVAQAAREGYTKSKEQWPVPFHGYYFRILKGQGSHAAGGACDYMVKGRMVRGFALVAYPARYGVSGVMTFIVNQEGMVYQKDLGPDTGTLAARMQLFDPDKSWKEVGGDGSSLPTVSDLSSPGNRSGDVKRESSAPGSNPAPTN